MLNRPSFAAVVVGVASVGLLATACSSSETSTASTTSQSVSADKKLRIGFFGFSKSSGFANATFKGISEYASSHNATVDFIDGGYNAPQQVQQLKDAVTAKRYDVWIVQSNDGNAVVPSVTAAIKQGVVVVDEYTPIGPRFDTDQPQLPGLLNVVLVPTDNGVGLGQLGLKACKQAAAKPCKVAYLEGLKSLPLDNARTNAVTETLKSDPDVQIVATVEGGYTPDTGRKAFQDVLQAHPDVNVVIGSGQAIQGAAPLVGDKKVLFIGNGNANQSNEAVLSGKWFAVYVQAEKLAGFKAAELGVGKARGQNVPTSVNYSKLAPFGIEGTKQTLQGFDAGYSD
jgi:ribose transport system substrate-binding protein